MSKICFWGQKSKNTLGIIAANKSVNYLQYSGQLFEYSNNIWRFGLLEFSKNEYEFYYLGPII